VKALFFHAAAASPRIAPALLGQAGNTLRPFDRFLNQAIHTAKERQFRYALPWQRVRNLLTLSLEALDSLLQIPRRIPGMLIADWPEGREPDLGQQAFVMNRGIPVRVLSSRHSGAGLAIVTDPPLQAGDSLVWCMHTCTLVPESEPLPPQEIATADGRPLKLLGVPLPTDDHCWQLLVEGRHNDMEVLVDGERLEAKALPSMDGVRRVRDSVGDSFDITEGKLKTEKLPAEGPLTGDNGIRLRWQRPNGHGQKGFWVQLLPPEKEDGEQFIDPRAAFCEDGVEEVWTEKKHRPNSVFKVRKVDNDRYQLLLNELPPEGTTLYLPIDLRNLQLQRRALYQLINAPLPHHQGLLRLCEDPEKVRWPMVSPHEPERWHALTDASRSGTDQQRRFVAKALASPDLALLEGPPGSGKTTAICEIVQHLVERGERVLLCASTHVAIDNVLERLLASRSPIDAVRIGKADRVDDKVMGCQLDARIEVLVNGWRQVPGMSAYVEAELKAMAERTVVMAANLTCGTTMGIVNHPLFRDGDRSQKSWERPIASLPHWDVLIVDEASKTLIQEFMVPALMARRWIVVGDVHQLPPFADRADMVANLRDLVDDKEKSLFSRDHQRACLLRYRLQRRQLRQPGMRWLLVEPAGVLDWLARELAARPADKDFSALRIVARSGRSDSPIPCLTVEQLKAGSSEALRLAAADWVLVGEDLLGEVADFLPSSLLCTRDLCSGQHSLPESSALLLRQRWWLESARQLPRPYKDRGFKREDISTFRASQACEQEWLSRNDLGQELAWRLTRLHELRHSQNQRELQRLHRDLDELQPAAVEISERLQEIQDIGLPSILEVLQEGIGEERSKRPSSLTEGMRRRRDEDFQARFESLSWQHRMHPEISRFSREQIYRGGSLLDANTIESRDARLGWDFAGFPSRCVWLHVDGIENSGENRKEVERIRALVGQFIDWARHKGAPRRSEPAVWEVACLCFYTKQERALSQMLKELTGDDRKSRFRVSGVPIEIVCGTVDRFQGREADLVLLSMRNTRRVGFLDSPNRLNVAVTRARQQLVIVGNAGYFERCGTAELEELAKSTRRMEGQDVMRRRRNKS
jgi:hypothetical protein